MKINKLAKIFLLLCLIGSSSVAVHAEDASSTELDQLNAAKNKVEEMKKTIAVYGDSITAWDFIKYHAQQHQDQKAEDYILTNDASVVDPEADESLSELQTTMQYLADVNALRKENDLNEYMISDEAMLAVGYPVKTEAEASASPISTASAEPESSASASPSVSPEASIEPSASTVPAAKLSDAFKEDITETTITALPEELSENSYTSAGITADVINKVYQVVLAQDGAEYGLSEYQTELQSFIDTNVTAYQTALKELDAAQKAYDAAEAASSSAEPTASASAESTDPTQAKVVPAVQSAANAVQATITSEPVLQLPTTTETAKKTGIKMLRLYNPYSGEHLYTRSQDENNYLVTLGWRAEGTGWIAPEKSTTPVYRLYNPYSGDHHYTINASERDYLVTLGWNDEGVGWYSDDDHEIPVYRQFNPYAQIGTHNYTVSKQENDYLATLGWRPEGIGWYGMGSYNLRGIDVSEHNGDIDLSSYQDGFVILRACWGTNLDKKFERNLNLCKQLGIKYGIYFYSYALNTEEATEEANYFVQVLKDYDCHPSVGVWLDMEDADSYKTARIAITNDSISSLCKTFCKIVKDSGYHVGIYASLSWFQYYISDCDEYDKWLAFWHYNDGTLTDMSSYGAPLHQYTSNPLDRDVMYVDVSHFTN